MFEISYDFTQKIGSKWVTHTNNLVGREGNMPVGYGKVGTSAFFRLEELPAVVAVLTKQLGTVPTLHLQPVPEGWDHV